MSFAVVKTEKGSLSRSFALNPPKFNWPEMLSKNVQLLNTSCGGVSTRLNRGSPDRPRNLIAQILTNRAIVIFLTNFGPLVNFFEIFPGIEGLLSKSENFERKHFLKLNPHTPDRFTPSHARCAENCGSALTYR